MDDMIDFPYEDYIRAAINWDKYTGIPRANDLTWPSFDNGLSEFLGHDPWHIYWVKGSTTAVSIPKHCLAKFQMLASPHFMTLLKAWAVKKADLTSSHTLGV